MVSNIRLGILRKKKGPHPLKETGLETQPFKSASGLSCLSSLCYTIQIHIISCVFHRSCCHGDKAPSGFRSRDWDASHLLGLHGDSAPRPSNCSVQTELPLPMQSTFRCFGHLSQISSHCNNFLDPYSMFQHTNSQHNSSGNSVSKI